MTQKAKTIKDDGYSIVMNQCLKVGTHIFSMGTAHSNYPIMERVITDEFLVDSYGYPCVILKDVETGARYQERLELLALSIHLHDSNDFLNKEEAMLCREKRLKKLEGSE